jgi:hypothetical protein
MRAHGYLALTHASAMNLPDWLSLDLLWIIPAVAAGLVALPFVLGPVLVRYTQKFTPAPGVTPISPDEFGLPPDVREYFDRAENELRAVGFSRGQCALVEGVVTGATAVLTLFDHSGGDDLAMVTVIYGFVENEGVRQVQLQTRYVEFQTEYTDGSVLNTNNSSEENAFPQNPRQTLYQLPQITNSADLYKAHCQGKQDLGGRAKKPYAPAERRLEVVAEEMAKVFSRQLETGYLFLSPDNYYRPTWIGAVRMTWKLSWPVVSVRRYLRRRRAHLKLMEWGLA